MRLATFTKTCAYLVLVLLSCNRGGTPTEDITLKMWVHEERYIKHLESRAQAFRELYPNVNISVEALGNEAYKTAIQVALVGSDPPDVFFNWSGEDAARLARSGLALDISELGSREGGFRNEISEAWQDAFRYNGKNYGVPTHAVSKYFYYSKPFFAQNNLSVPSTFEELKGMCRAIRNIDTDMVPLPLGNSERWKVNHYITLLNERVLGMEDVASDYSLASPNETLFTNPGYVQAWEKLTELQGAGCFQDAPNATSPEVTRSMFASEVSPAIFCGTWCLSTFDEEGFTDYGLFRFPGISGGKGSSETNMLVPEGFQVSAKTKHPEEAVAWLSFLVSPEGAMLWAQDLGYLPSNSARIDEVDASEQFKWVAKDISTLKGTFNVLDVLLEASVANAYLDAGVEVIGGSKTPAQAMEYIREFALKAKAKMESS